MDPQIPNAEMRALKDENKVLKGKIRGYQTLGQLFQETKEKNRILQAELQTKEMVSVGTETRPLSLPSGTNDIPENESRNLMEIPNKIPKSAQEECPSANAYHESAYHHDEQSDPLELSKSSLACALKSKSQWQPFSSIENVDRPEEVNLHLRKKLEDALQMVGELDRKRSNDKKLVKILNDEVKKTKDELQFIKQQLEKTLREKELVMNKVAILERERDNIPDNTVIPLTTGKEAEGAEDWVHLKPETAMEATDEKDYQLQQLEERCKELHEKAFKWENEHFTLQMEYTKHITDLRLLLESKSKELVAVTESLNSDKKLLETKFKTLEVMLKKEKDDKMESYNLHQETIRKYKLLEKKFLALEAKNKASISKGADSIQFEMMNVAKQTVSTSDEKVLGLQQQINLFKDDFVKEKKERVFAEKRAKEFEEKLRYLSKQLAKKESDLQHIQLRESPLYNTHVPKTSKMPPCWSCDYCTFLNDPQVEECKICKAPKTSRAERPGWKCNYCTYLNSYKTDMCCVCNVVRTKNADVGSNQPLDDDLTIDGPQTE